MSPTLSHASRSEERSKCGYAPGGGQGVLKTVFSATGNQLGKDTHPRLFLFTENKAGVKASTVEKALVPKRDIVRGRVVFQLSGA